MRNKQCRMKRLSAAVLSALTLLAFAGCQAEGGSESSSPPADTSGENPFSSEQLNDESVMFAYGFGLVSPEADTNMVYDGKPIQAECFVDNGGAAMSVGILIFVDGIPQPYQVGDEAESYMHIHEAPAMQKTTFSFSFTPVCGKKGQSMSVRFLSILNPQNRPDKPTYSFGHTGAMTTFFPRTLEIQQDVPTAAPQYPRLPAQRDMTEEEIEQVIYNNSKGETINELNAFNLFVEKTSQSEDNCIDARDGTFTVETQAFGGPATDYVLIPYINYIPVTTGNFPGLLTVQEGKTIFREEFTFDVSKLDKDTYQLERYNTFHMLAIPVDGNTMLDPMKSQSWVLELE